MYNIMMMLFMKIKKVFMPNSKDEFKDEGDDYWFFVTRKPANRENKTKHDL